MMRSLAVVCAILALTACATPASPEQWAERARAWSRGEDIAELPHVGEPAPAMPRRDVFVYFISSRQWYDLQQSATTKDWNALTTNALKRSQNFNHPVFRGDTLMKENILVRKMPKRVRFDVGYNVKVAQNNLAATTELRTAPVAIERSFLLGSQALGVAFGHTKTTKTHFNIHQEKADHGNVQEYSIAYCNGKKALQFKDRAGRLHCHGRIIVDTAVSAGF